MRTLIIPDRISGENNKDYAYRVLMDNIVSLNLAPGAKLSENELASQLGLSRTPVREALMELSKLHLVEVYPQRGTFVSLISKKNLDDAILGRLAIEGAVIMDAAVKATPEDIQALKASIAIQEVYLESTTWLDYDQDFHRLIFEIADRMFLYRQMQYLTVQFDRVRSSNRSSTSNNRINFEDHLLIAKAIESHDPNAARDAVCAHVSRFNNDKWDEVFYQLYPDYFTT